MDALCLREEKSCVLVAIPLFQPEDCNDRSHLLLLATMRLITQVLSPFYRSENPRGSERADLLIPSLASGRDRTWNPCFTMAGSLGRRMGCGHEHTCWAVQAIQSGWWGLSSQFFRPRWREDGGMQKVCRRLMLVVKQGKLGCLGHALLLQGAKHLPHRAPFPVPCRIRLSWGWPTQGHCSISRAFLCLAKNTIITPLKTEI